MVGAGTDSTGSIIPGAKVTVTNKGAGFVFTSDSTSEGTWDIPNLNPGNYQLKIEAAGFKAYGQDAISLRTADRPLLDVRPEVGAATGTHKTTGAPPPV